VLGLRRMRVVFDRGGPRRGARGRAVAKPGDRPLLRSAKRPGPRFCGWGLACETTY